MCIHIHTYRHVSGFGGDKSLRPDLDDGRDAGAPGCVCNNHEGVESCGCWLPHMRPSFFDLTPHIAPEPESSPVKSLRRLIREF